MQYFIEPPTLNFNVPKFLLKRMVTASARKMIQWAITEYMSAVSYYRKIGDNRSAKFIEKNLSECSVLSKHPDFKKLCESMDSETFNSLDRRERRFLTEAYQKLYSPR